MSRKPGRIIRSVESGSRRLARGVFGFSRSSGYTCNRVRIEARTGLRMMPTFPRSAPIIPYGGFSPVRLEGWLSKRCLSDDRRLKPAPGMRRPTSSLHPPFVRLVVTTVVPHCVGPQNSIAHRPGGSLLLRPRGPRSSPGYSVPVRRHLVGPIRPARGHTAISPHGGLYAMPSLCGSA